MELNTVYLKILMFYCHNFTVISFCCYFKTLWHCVFNCRQGMVSCGSYFIGKFFKNLAFGIYFNNALLAMHKFFCIAYRCTKGFTYSLMTKANSENWNFSSKIFYCFYTYSCFRVRQNRSIQILSLQRPLPSMLMRMPFSFKRSSHTLVVYCEP